MKLPRLALTTQLRLDQKKTWICDFFSKNTYRDENDQKRSIGGFFSWKQNRQDIIGNEYVIDIPVISKNNNSQSE
jgi:hypothetical protein